MAANSAQRNQAQLNADLAAGPIFYRRVPGPGRKYYDPMRPENPTVSEHYVLRVYKPKLNQIQRQQVNQRVRDTIKLQRQQKLTLAETWSAKQASLGRPVTPRNLTLKDQQFKQAYDQYRIESWTARHQGLENPNRAAYFAPGSTYDQSMVQMGRRTGEEDFPIGESPKHAGQTGSYIDDVVKPYLEGQAVKASQQQRANEVANERRARLQARQELRRETGI